ncbi:MAG: hypothetical protein WCL30_06855, partial [Pseudomonadota bacterium]
AKSDDLDKAGSRNSKADLDKIQSMHDNTVALGADCGAAKHDHSSDIAKFDKLAGDFAELEKSFNAEKEKNEALEKRVKELEASPAAPKAVLKVVGKSDDLGTVGKADASEPAADDIEGQIKKVLSSPPTIKFI